MTKWYFGNSSGPRDWERDRNNPRDWERDRNNPRDWDIGNPYKPYGFNPYDWKKTFKHYVNTLERFLNHKDVQKRIEGGEKVVAKVKRGNKIYRMTIEDITPPSEEDDDKITIEFEETPPDKKHPDYTE
jgi:hypothetical protein